MESLGSLKGQGVLGEQVGWWAASGQSTAAEWRRLGSRETQNEMGPEQTDRHAWLLPGVAMWSRACLFSQSLWLWRRQD